MRKVRAIPGKQPCEWVVQEFSVEKVEPMIEGETSVDNEIIHRSVSVFCTASNSSEEAALAVFEESKLPPVVDAAAAAAHKKRLEYRAKKQDVELQLSNIVIEFDGLSFDGDRDARNALTSAITGMNAGESMQWKLSDNTVVIVSRAQLKQALRLVGVEQTRIITA